MTDILPAAPIDPTTNYADIAAAITSVQALITDGLTVANFHDVLAAVMQIAATKPITSAAKKAFVQEVFVVLISKYVQDPLVAQLLREIVPCAIDVLCGAAHGLYEFSIKETRACVARCHGCAII